MTASGPHGVDAAEAMNRIAQAVEEAMGVPVKSEPIGPPQGRWLPLSVRYAAAEAAAKVVVEWRASNAGEQTTEADGIDLLTAEEREALDLSGKLAVLCRRIVGSGPQSHDDWNELAARIHAVQHTIMSQAAARAYPGQFRLLGGTIAGPPSGQP